MHYITCSSCKTRFATSHGFTSLCEDCELKLVEETIAARRGSRSLVSLYRAGLASGVIGPGAYYS